MVVAILALGYIVYWIEGLCLTFSEFQLMMYTSYNLDF